MSENDNGFPPSNSDQPANPKDTFEQLLCHHGQVFVALDGRDPGVVLPEHLTQEEVVLDYNLNAAIPILDLEASDEGIRATLSFSREPFQTFVPWSAVIEMVGKRPVQETPKKRPNLTLV